MFLDKLNKFKEMLQQNEKEEAPLPPVPAQEPEEEPQPEVIVPADTTTIGKGIVFYGDFSGEDPIVVNGSIEGNIQTTAKLTISGDGSYKGRAYIENLHSEGSIEGDVVCKQLSCFGAASSMSGTLKTACLETAHGSFFKGDLRLNTGEEQVLPVEQPAEPAGDLTAAEDAAGFTAADAQQLQQAADAQDPYAGLSEEDAALLREAEADMRRMAELSSSVPEAAAEQPAQEPLDGEALRDLADGIRLPDFLDLEEKPTRKNNGKNGKRK